MPAANLLFILADQCRRQVLGCYGDPHGATPHLDTMAADGVRFANACSTYPICVPFRYTLMTGQYAHTRDVPGIKWRMSPSERTLADDFNEAGYESIYIGKWHLFGGLGEQYFHQSVPRPYQGRWQKWLGFEFRNGHFDTAYFEDDDPTPRPLGRYQTDGLTDLMMEYLVRRRDKSRPFACVLSVEPPHFPYEAPEELERKWLDRELSLPPNFMVPGDWDRDATGSFWLPRQQEHRDNVLRRRKIYYAMVENLDQNIGRIMAWLRQAGLDRDTAVVFTSDHGELSGSHAMEEKQYPYEESIGIPLIIRPPGFQASDAPRGRVIADPTCTEDLYPTLLGMVGLKPRDALAGTDLSPLALGRTDRLDRPGIMLEFVCETRAALPFHKRQYRGFRSQGHKYTVLGSPLEGLRPWQFFDLQRDPYELQNLIDDPRSSTLVAQHHAWLRQRMKETGDNAPLPSAFGQPALNVRLREPLPSGYDPGTGGFP